MEQQCNVQFSVFSKSWKDLSVSQLGKYIKGLGFDGIEFPLRKGFQVEPDDAEKGLPRLVNQLADYGLKVYSVASSLDERIFAACAEAGIPIIRTMVLIEQDGYLATEQRTIQQLEQLIPLCEKYGVKIGIQPHCGPYVSSSAGLLRVIEKFDPAHVGAVWDAAHDALQGEGPEMGLEIVWSHLCMVNLKNALWQRKNGLDSEVAEWEEYYISGKKGLASWPRVANVLKEKSYNGVICLTAEYSEHDQVDRLIAEDIAFAKSLFV